MKLYGHRGSPFVRKALVVLEEKGLRYESVELSSVPGRKSPELLELHPLGKIPVLRDGDVVVPDSSVVCAYLEKKHPTPALYPDEPADLARALFLEEYSDTRLFEVLSGILFERVVKPRVMGQPPDEARALQLFERELPPVLDYLESQLRDGAPTLLSRFSVADAAIGGQLATLTLSGLAIDRSRWPRSARYHEALRSRPSFVSAMRR
ncbi:MAG TPA: glutathione S-transferase family protein [Myxococcota bacterium]|nr:glutathione S-transferase family protein [Myxococcota bacterium]